jgi:hypothetical protein
VDADCLIETRGATLVEGPVTESLLPLDALVEELVVDTLLLTPFPDECTMVLCFEVALDPLDNLNFRRNVEERKKPFVKHIKANNFELN